MTRVLMATHSWGVHLDPAGNVRAGQTASIANLDATAATHWSAKTAGTSSTGAMATDANGYLQRWIDVGSYLLTDTYGAAYSVEAVSGADLAAASGGVTDSSVTVKGVVKLATAPVLGTNPIAVGTNDPRLADARTPVSHTHVATTDLTATGTKNSTTFLRGDNTWALSSGIVVLGYRRSGTFTATSGVERFVLPRAFTVIGVRALLTTAGSVQTLVDVNSNGTTIFTDQTQRPTVAASALNGVEKVPAVTALPADAAVTVDVDAQGTDALSLSVQIIGRWT